MFTLLILQDCIKRIKIQDSKLKEQTKKILSYMLDSREDLIKHVFKYEDNIKFIYLLISLELLQMFKSVTYSKRFYRKYHTT